MPTKRETIKPNPGDKRFIRRDERGRFTSEQVEVGRSLSSDRRQRARKEVDSGQGDRGDQRRSA